MRLCMFSPADDDLEARLAGPDRRRQGRAARGADAAVVLHRRLVRARARRVPAGGRAPAGARARAARGAAVRGRRRASRSRTRARSARRARSSPGPAAASTWRRGVAAVIGLDGAIGGWTGLAEWRAPELAPPKDRDFALLLGPVVDTELDGRLRLGGRARSRGAEHPATSGRPARGAAARAARGRPERPARARDRRRRHARRDRRLTLPQGYPPRHALLPAPRRRSAQAAHPVPRQRHPAHRRGDGARGLHRQRVDPLPPPVALPRDGDRRLRADRARGVGAGDPPAPDDAHEGRRGRRRRGHRPQAPDVERRRRDLALPADGADGLLLPQRRGRRGDLRPRGVGHARDDLREPALQGRRLRRHPARHDLPVRARRGRAALPRLRDARPDRDPAPLPQPVRPDHRRARRTTTATSTRPPS